MPLPVYIGDEVAAAGFGLAGLELMTPAIGEEAAALVQARAHASLVLVSAEIATRIPAVLLEPALAAASPITVLVPDLLARVELPDPATPLRRQLGIEA
ncbi:MAG: hypothetical protein RR412_01250 [Burkholderiaceae bacterium]